MNKKKNEDIVSLVKSVSEKCGYERSAICAVDCLLQWNEGFLDENIAVWKEYLDELKQDSGWIEVVKETDREILKALANKSHDNKILHQKSRRSHSTK